MINYFVQRLKRELAQDGLRGLVRKYPPADMVKGMLLMGVGAVASFRLAVVNRLERSDAYVRCFRAPLVRRFNKLYFMLSRNTFDRTYFMGKHVIKFPTDLWTYQEIIYECKPDVIVETGVFLGGSTFYFAKLCELFGRGRVIAVESAIEHVDPEVLALPNVKLIQGSSRDPQVLEQVRSMIRPGERVMVVLDADHTPAHVYPEMKLFSTLVTEGQYLVVEDGIIDHVYPALWRRRGPLRAIRRFLAESPDFQVDSYRTRFLLTHSPSGYLRRVGAVGPLPAAREEDNLRPFRLTLAGLAPDAPWRERMNQNRPGSTAGKE